MVHRWLSKKEQLTRDREIVKLRKEQKLKISQLAAQFRMGEGNVVRILREQERLLGDFSE